MSPNKAAAAQQAQQAQQQHEVTHYSRIGPPALAAGAAHILADATLENQFGITLKPAVPLLDIRHHLAKGLVIGNGDVNGVDAALAHLPEDLFRPVAILEAVDHMHLRTYEAGPVEI